MVLFVLYQVGSIVICCQYWVISFFDLVYCGVLNSDWETADQPKCEVIFIVCTQWSLTPNFGLSDHSAITCVHWVHS